MKRERLNDDDETEGLQYRNTSGGIKYRVLNVKTEKSLSNTTTVMPTNLSTGFSQEDSSSGEDMVLSLGGQNVSQSFLNNNGGHIYFMLPPDSSLASANQSSLMTRINRPDVCLLSPDDAETNGVNGLPRRGARDDKRRATHNEVERRRRGKINSSIEQLGSILPITPVQNGAKQNDSKGAILSKACDYITELKFRNDELRARLKDLYELKEKCNDISGQLEVAREENHILRENLSNNVVHIATVD